MNGLGLKGDFRKSSDKMSLVAKVRTSVGVHPNPSTKKDEVTYQNELYESREVKKNWH